MYDASSRKDIRKAEKVAARIERDQIEFLSAAMNTIQGRTWFHEFLAQCHLFADPFTGDALREAYSKGERNIGLSIYADIVAHCPDQFVTMMREATIRTLTNDRRNASPDDNRNPDPIATHDSYDTGGDELDGSKD